jgi:hypothetical protein
VPFIAAIVAMAALFASHEATETGMSPAFAQEFVP